MNQSRQRSFSGRKTGPQRKSHIHSVQEQLNKKKQLIDKYQSEINDRISQINSQNPNPKNSAKISESITNSPGRFRQARRHKLSSQYRNDTYQIQKQKELFGSGSMKDYQKVILGLEYALEAERKKVEDLGQRNVMLQTEISNLRNVLVGPDEKKQYEKTVMKEMQDKIGQLEDKLLDQKKNYQFIIESKNQAITSLESQMRTLQKQFQSKLSTQKESKESTLTKKMLQLMSQLQEQRTTITQKNIQLQSLKYKKQQYNLDSGDESDDQIKKLRKVEKIKFYLQQLETANKMIIKKNIEILNLGNKVMKLEQVVDLVEMYLDKKEVRNIDMNVLQMPVIIKLRVLLRQKATFERQLLGQLNEHNKKIQKFQTQIASKQTLTTTKLSQVISDNKKLSTLISSLQLNIKNLQKSLSDEKRQNEYLKNEVQIQKKQFIEEVKKLKGDLGTISSVTKSQFDRMKLENLKLSEQNRSLLFLVGQKQRELHRKGQTIRTFQDYKQKINSLDVSISQQQKRRIEKTPQDNTPQIGSKLLLINNFSGWMFEWNKIKSWNNKKVLLNLLLDKDDVRNDALGQMNMLIDVIHECLLHSKNVEVQERAIILVQYYLKDNILKHSSLYLDKIAPIMIRGFRQRIEGQEQQKLRLLNESTLKIFSQLSKSKYQWSPQLTNEMLSVNGLKYLFSTVNDNPIDDIIQMAFQVLIMITKQNEMVSFMISFNVTELILKNLNNKYGFIVFLLQLLINLLRSDDFLRAQKSFLEFRKIVLLIRDDDDQEVLMLALECMEILMTTSQTFVKSLNKVQAISIMNGLVKGQTDARLLKKTSTVYGLLVQNFDEDSVQKYVKSQLDKILKIISEKNISDVRFITSLKIILKVSEQINQRNDLDQKIVQCVFQIFQLYESIQQKSRLRINKILDVIYERNKSVINKFSTDNFLANLVQSYKSAQNMQEIVILLKILLFENEQKHTTQLLRSGRQAYIDKLITDCMSTKNYQLAILALKNLLALAREKYIEKFINIKLVAKIVNKVLKERGEEEYLSLGISVLYFMSKNEQVSVMVIESHAVERISEIMTERHDKQALIFKCFALLQLLHTMNYKRRILNHFLTSDPKMQTIKTFNYILRRAVNKTQMGARSVFFYDYLLTKGVIQSLAILMQNNDWMVEDLISTRNQYIGKVDSLVYKIQMILNGVCQQSKKLNKIYQRFKVQGEISSGDEDE